MTDTVRPARPADIALSRRPGHILWEWAKEALFTMGQCPKNYSRRLFFQEPTEPRSNWA